MNKFSLNLIVAFLFPALTYPFIAYAVSYSPVTEQREEKIAKGIRETGETVCLFQSGTEDVRKEIHVNDLLIVYRDTASQTSTQVGKIRVLSFIGADYLRCAVVEGEVRTGNIAKKGAVASLVISSEDRCK